MWLWSYSNDNPMITLLNAPGDWLYPVSKWHVCYQISECRGNFQQAAASSGPAATWSQCCSTQLRLFAHLLQSSSGAVTRSCFASVTLKVVRAPQEALGWQEQSGWGAVACRGKQELRTPGFIWGHMRY